MALALFRFSGYEASPSAWDDWMDGRLSYGRCSFMSASTTPHSFLATPESAT